MRTYVNKLKSFACKSKQENSLFLLWKECVEAVNLNVSLGTICVCSWKATAPPPKSECNWAQLWMWFLHLFILNLALYFRWFCCGASEQCPLMDIWPIPVKELLYMLFKTLIPTQPAAQASTLCQVKSPQLLVCSMFTNSSPAYPNHPIYRLSLTECLLQNACKGFWLALLLFFLQDSIIAYYWWDLLVKTIVWKRWYFLRGQGCIFLDNALFKMYFNIHFSFNFIIK